MHPIKGAVFLPVIVAFLAANALLSYTLYPYTYTRAMFHEMETADYDTLIIGGSHAKCGVDPSVLKEKGGFSAINAAQGGEHTIDMYYLVRKAAESTELKTVICEIDPSYWVDEPNQTQEYVSVYHDYPWSFLKAGYFARKMLRADFRTAPFEWYLYRQQISHLPELLREKGSREYREYDISQFTDTVQSYHEDGFIARFRVEEGTTREDVPALWDRTQYNADEQKYFEKTVDFCRKSGIEMTAVVMPIPDATYEAYRESYDDALAFFREYMAARGVTLLDYLAGEDGGNQESASRDRAQRVPHNLDDFCDNEGHMYEDAAAAFSEVLAEDLKRL
ncbi:MAG: hypothetical protein Q4A32_08320 [Lachnospiraceae bacterium]|nr:hypothetical protein [Lachnospiraceae bacterium]